MSRSFLSFSLSFYRLLIRCPGKGVGDLFFERLLSSLRRALLRVEIELLSRGMLRELILMKKQSMSDFSFDLEEERLERLLLEAVLWSVFLVRRFSPKDDSRREVSSRKLLSDMADIYEIPFFSMVMNLYFSSILLYVVQNGPFSNYHLQQLLVKECQFSCLCDIEV